MCWWNASATGSLDTGALHDVGDISTCSGSASVNAPLVRWSGPETLRVALPAVDVTVAVVDASYVLSDPGMNVPNEAGPFSVSASVAGTVPPTPTVPVCAWSGEPGAGASSSSSAMVVVGSPLLAVTFSR